jgi:endonuclease/exonuclease/phosphatase family metal-dependent hydrolase
VSQLRLITWNVLHRIHGEKWSKHVVRNFPNESVRIERVAARVAQWLTQGSTVVCLQEVSGDQLAALRESPFISHRYGRVPSWWRFWTRPLRDAAEHLAVGGADLRFVAGLTFADDDGKGLLAAEVGGLRIVSAHLTFGRAGAAQLHTLKELAGLRAVIAGDFNADRQTVAQTLGKGFAVADASEQATRVAGARLRRGYSVDHIAVAGGTVADVEVLDSEGLSDHHPLRATVTC